MYGTDNGTQQTNEYSSTGHDGTLDQDVCPYCQEGFRGLFRLSDKNKSIVLICDECNAIWLEPNKIGWGQTASNNDLKARFKVKDSEELFDKKNSGWATKKEAINSQWDELADALLVN